VYRTVLKSKIHRATLTATDLNYEGSIAIDPELLAAADILPGEQVHVLNVNNGERLITYAITGEKGSGEMMLNGPAARLACTGDLVIIITFAQLDEKEMASHSPKVLLVDENNRVK